MRAAAQSKFTTPATNIKGQQQPAAAHATDAVPEADNQGAPRSHPLWGHEQPQRGAAVSQATVLERGELIDGRGYEQRFSQDRARAHHHRGE